MNVEYYGSSFNAGRDLVITNNVIARDSSTEFDKVSHWLRSPDPSVNQNRLQDEREPDTGLWLIESDELRNWQNFNDAVVWIRGIPGNGKSVLCSTVIEHFTQYASKKKLPLVYYYFDFRDTEKQTYENILRSFLFQLHNFLGTSHPALSSLYSTCLSGTRKPNTEQMADSILEIFHDYSEGYLFGEGLDECNEKDRIRLLGLLKKVSEHRNIRIFISGRPEKDIVLGLSALKNGVRVIDLSRGSGINRDIAQFVERTLKEDPRYAGFDDAEKTLIVQKLSSENWMFRWAALQLEKVAECVTHKQLEDTLQSLPDTLDATYDRILNGVSSKKQPQLFRLMQWLCFSYGPLYVEELIAALNVGDKIQPPFDDAERVKDILLLCPSLITVSNHPLCPFITFSHFSVKEYLLRTKRNSVWNIMLRSSHISISRCCIAYLLQPNSPFNLVSQPKLLLYRRFPLLTYAVDYVEDHIKLIGDAHEIQESLRLFFNPSPSSLRSLLLYEKYAGVWGVPYWDNLVPGLSLRIACKLGLYNIVRDLLRINEVKECINRYYGSLFPLPLHNAWRHNHQDIVQLLISEGADINALDLHEQGLLYYAVLSGDIDKIRFLVETGADDSKQDYGALRYVITNGKLKLLKVFLDVGYDPNVCMSYLKIFSFRLSADEYETIKNVLLDRGARL